jgi:hypothetical protein
MVNETATGRLVDRWPTAVGLVLAAATVAAIVSGADVDLGPGVAAMMAIYTATWAIGRPMAAFWVFGGLIVITVLAILVDVEGAIAMAVVLGLTWIWALVTRRTEDSRWLTIETLGVLFFGSLTIAAFLADARLGVVLAGVGWFTHGLWDAYHFVKNRIVSRSWSELCAVVDIPVGTALIVVGLLG